MQEAIDKKGRKKVAEEIGYSPSSIAVFMSGKWSASPDKIVSAIISAYGGGALVECPILGEITLVECRKNQKDARIYKNMPCGDPLTARVFAHCPVCEVKEGGKQ